jgi:hypothetical protein
MPLGGNSGYLLSASLTPVATKRSAQSLSRVFAAPSVPIFGLDRGQQPVVVGTKASLQFGVLRHLIHELPRAASEPFHCSEVPKLLLASANEELFYVLIDMIAPT